MEGTLRCTLGSQAQHAYYLEDHTRSIQQSTSTHTKHIHNIQQQNSNHTQTHSELFPQTIHKHCQTRNTQDKQIHQQSNTQNTITRNTTHVQEAIKQSKNNNSQGPDKLNIRHPKHMGPLGLAFLTSMLKTALNTTIIPHIWKLVNIVPIPKPNKDINKGTSYRPIPLLSVIADTGEEPSSLHNHKHTNHTFATRVQNTTLYSDGTAHSKQHRSKGVQPNGSPCANNHCSTQYEESFRQDKYLWTYTPDNNPPYQIPPDIYPSSKNIL